MARNRCYKFRKIKPVISFVYGYRCIVCNHFSYENHVHHLNGNADDNTVYNLVLLCDYHHKMVHKGIQLNYPALSEFQGRILYELEKLWSS